VNPANLERPMTTTQVTDALNISRSTLLNLATREENPLPSIKIGAHYRFFWSDIVIFFNIPERKVVPSKPVSDITPDNIGSDFI